MDLVNSDENIKLLATQITSELNAGRIRLHTDQERLECQRHAEIILLDLLAAVNSDPTLHIGYSRGKQSFEKDGCYWNQVRGIRMVSYPYFITVINYLEAQEFIENHTATPGRNSYSSRMRANEGLIRLFSSGGSNWASVQVDLDAPSIFVKNEDKVLVAYPDVGTFNLKQAQHNLRRINENLHSSLLNISISDETTDLILRQKRGRINESDEAELDDGYRQPIDFSNRKLQRIFALNSFDNGGRFYGGWWQQVPSNYVSTPD